MNEPPLDSPAKRPPPIADSPWFWLVLFGGMGLVALLAIGPKYGRRQAKIERKYQARQQMLLAPDGTPIAGETRPPTDVEYSTPDDTIVKLWPIRVVLLLVTVVAAGMLIRQRIAQHRACAAPARDNP